MKARLRLVAAALLCCASAASAQTASLDREVKATPGREVRVGIYTSMRGDCTAGPLPAIRLADCARTWYRHRTARDTQSDQCQAVLGG